MARRVDYYFKTTVEGLRRNGLVAFAAISTSFIALFLVGVAFLVQTQVNRLIKATEADVEISVFLKDGISQSQQNHIGDLLNAMPQVQSVNYESKQDAYERFKEIFKNEQTLVQNISPNSLPASFRVKLKDPRQYQVVVAQIQGQPGIDNIIDHRQFLSRLFAVTAVFRVGMFSVALMMLISAAALIMNTVRLAVFNRRKEIGIMRLVGATNWHIRVPFLIEGIFEGLIGAGAAVLGLFIMVVAFVQPLSTKIQFVPWITTHDVFSTIWILVAGGVGVAIIASLLAMRRFLEV
jgi:cell division transport system permease protein